jgi:methionine-rich copper-binding protein CopC
MTKRLPSPRTILVAALLVVMAGWVAATQVFAHSRPLRFDPAPGAVLQTAPSQVTGWFTGDIRRDPNWSFIQVTDAQGQRVDSGETQLSTDRLQMTAALRPGLPPGAYLVTWRTWDDADGEIFGDCYVFYVGQAAADAGIAAKTRLDGGSRCQRIELAAKEGTPTPQQVSANATAIASGSAGDHPHGDDNGLVMLVVGLVVGVVGGAVAGAFAMRMVARRA